MIYKAVLEIFAQPAPEMEIAEALGIFDWTLIALLSGMAEQDPALRLTRAQLASELDARFGARAREDLFAEQLLDLHAAVSVCPLGTGLYQTCRSLRLTFPRKLPPLRLRHSF